MSTRARLGVVSFLNVLDLLRLFANAARRRRRWAARRRSATEKLMKELPGKNKKMSIKKRAELEGKLD